MYIIISIKLKKFLTHIWVTSTLTGFKSNMFSAVLKFKH